MHLEVKKVTIVPTSGADICIVDLEGIWPSENNLEMKFEVAKGQGKEYIKNNFPDVELEIINKEK